jgi:SNF2 family DNA or RNA helicase
LVETLGYKFDFDMVVIDELSSFKNYNSQRFKSLMRVRPKVKRMVGLTGTPSSNGLMDLFAEFKVLDMGRRLGRFIGEYRTNYFEPDKRNGQIIFSYKPLPNAEERIYEKISDITISMKSTDYLEMPALHYLTPLKYFDVYAVARNGFSVLFLLISIVIVLCSVVRSQRSWANREI